MTSGSGWGGTVEGGPVSLSSKNLNCSALRQRNSRASLRSAKSGTRNLSLCISADMSAPFFSHATKCPNGRPAPGLATPKLNVRVRLQLWAPPWDSTVQWAHTVLSAGLWTKYPPGTRNCCRNWRGPRKPPSREGSGGSADSGGGGGSAAGSAAGGGGSAAGGSARIPPALRA
eukprot:1346234-Pyramimonas_sp.AAC.2